MQGGWQYCGRWQCRRLAVEQFVTAEGATGLVADAGFRG